jgi:hypothetical protein
MLKRRNPEPHKRMIPRMMGMRGRKESGEMSMQIPRMTAATLQIQPKMSERPEMCLFPSASRELRFQIMLNRPGMMTTAPPAITRWKRVRRSEMDKIIIPMMEMRIEISDKVLPFIVLVIC